MSSVGAMRGLRPERRAESGLGHAQRQVDVFAGILVEGFSADDANNFSQQFEVDVAIDEAFTGLRQRLVDERFLNAEFVAAPWRFEVEIGTQPGEVGEQVTNRDIALASLKAGEVRRHRVSEPDLALLEKLHDGGRRCDDFGEGRGVEDGVERHRFGEWE